MTTLGAGSPAPTSPHPGWRAISPASKYRARPTTPRAVVLESLASDLDDTQGGTTAEGIHLGAMAGTVDLLQRAYTGLEPRDDTLYLNPRLPDDLPRLRFEIRYSGQHIDLDITHHDVTLRTRPCDDAPVRVTVGDHVITLPADATRTVSLDDSSAATRRSAR